MISGRMISGRMISGRMIPGLLRGCCLLPIMLVALTQTAQATPQALVRLAAAREQALSPTVTAYGTVAPDPDHVTRVTIPREGMVASVSVRVGQLVHVGDPIATIETAPGASAAFQQARSAFAFAEQDLAHTKALYAQQLATSSQLAGAQQAYQDAKSQLQAQQKIGSGQARQVLRATAPGIVTAVPASPGERVQANAAVATIASRDRLLLNLGVEPGDAWQIPVGASVSLTSPQSDRIDFTGSVQSVDAMMDPTSRLVNAVVDIPQSVAAELILGMVLEGTIQLPAQSGIVVPRSALMTDQDGTFVYVVTNGVAHRHAVAVVLETDAEALIQGDVSAGETVVSAGNAALEEGTHVRVQ